MEPRRFKVEFTAEELYCIERIFDQLYTVALNSIIGLDRTRAEINCFMDKDNPGREELLKRNSEQERIVARAFIIYHGISNTCETIWKREDRYSKKSGKNLTK